MVIVDAENVRLASRFSRKIRIVYVEILIDLFPTLIDLLATKVYAIAFHKLCFERRRKIVFTSTHAIYN